MPLKGKMILSSVQQSKRKTNRFFNNGIFMDIRKEDIAREINRIRDALEKNVAMNDDDLKIILLEMLDEEDLHESKQQ